MRKSLWLTVPTLLAALALAQNRLPVRRHAGGTAGQLVEQHTRRRHALRSHILLTFETLDADTLKRLSRRGLQPVSHVPPRGMIVVASDDTPLAGLGIVFAAALPARQKLSALIEEEGVAVADFHPGVSQGDMRAIVLDCGLTIREHPDLLAQQVLVAGTRRQLEELARWDEVAHVFPASAELKLGLPVASCPGAVTEFGPLAQYVALAGEGWDGPGLGSAALGWVLTHGTARIPQETQRAELARAFAEWARHIQVTFSQEAAAGRPKTIELLFARGDHGDGFPFDGPGRVLAHTFYPAPPNPEPIAGDVHFDDDEAWSVGGNLDLFTVALHELGHALGLGHSDQPGAVMYPYYRRAQALTDEDIRAVRRIYAARSETPAPPAAPPAPPTVPPTPAPPSVPGSRENTPPALTILSPAGTNTLTAASTITLRGTARDSDGIEEVTWSATGGRTGTASGTNYWIAEAVPLLTGANSIVVRARDRAGKTSWRSITVTRR